MWKMTEFNPQTATADELWNFYDTKYQSKNPIIRWMLANYFAKISNIISLLDNHDHLLEVGCGTGVSSRYILDMLNGQQFQVSDFDERLISKLKKTNFPLPVKMESVLDLKHQDREFDCVFLLEVLEHVTQYERALSEVFRVSRKYVVVSVPHEPLWRILNVVRGKYLKGMGNTPSHVNHWSLGCFSRLISRYGTVLKIYLPIPWIIVLVQVKKLF